jgi:1-phosphofructokinase family hexose kinase
VIRCLALSAALDVTYLVDDFTVGGIHRPSAVLPSAGGKALNVARVVERLGSPVWALAVLGGHTGRRVRDLLTLPVEVIEHDAETRTCISIASGGALTELYEPAVPLDPTTWRRAADALLAAVEPGDWVAISGSQPDGTIPDLAALVARLRERGTRVAVDTHGAALAALTPTLPDLVKVNRAEASKLLATEADTDAAALAAQLAALTGGVAVVTDGEHGSHGATPEGLVSIAPDPVRGAFPVGSGDSYLAGLLHGLAGGVSLPQALRFAAACASANAAIPGAGNLRLDDVEAAFERIGVA